MKKTFKAGFTLIELLVVISIIGMLAGMLLPAVQAAREAGRRNSCLNNQKQLATALTMHQDAKKKFPTWRTDDKTYNAGTASAYVLGWMPQIFPYMEQTQIYDQVQNNGIRADVTIPSFQCPSAGSQSEGSNSYAANCGVADGAPLQLEDGSWALDAFAKNANNGVFLDGVGGGKGLSIDDLKDGASNTVLVSENLQAGGIWANREFGVGFCVTFPQADVWQYGSAAIDQNGNETISTIAPLAPNRARDLKTYEDLTINDSNPWAEWGDLKENVGDVAWAYARMSSAHPGLVVAGFADGSVRTINEGVDYQVLVRVMAPNDKKSTFNQQGLFTDDGVLDLGDL